MIKGARPCFHCLARKHGYLDPKSMLENLYWDRMLTPKTISTMLGVSFTAVTRRIHFYGIPVRPRGTAGRPKRRTE